MFALSLVFSLTGVRGLLHFPYLLLPFDVSIVIGSLTYKYHVQHKREKLQNSVPYCLEKQRILVVGLSAPVEIQCGLPLGHGGLVSSMMHDFSVDLKMYSLIPNQGVIFYEESRVRLVPPKPSS